MVMVRVMVMIMVMTVWGSGPFWLLVEIDPEKDGLGGPPPTCGLPASRDWEHNQPNRATSLPAKLAKQMCPS